MRARGLLAGAMVALSLNALSGDAHAEPMDFALERLVLNPSCHQYAVPGGVAGMGTWNTMAGQCRADNVAFKRLVNQYGFAMAPTAMHSARTTGYGGFELSFEGDLSSLDNKANYFVYGTRGATDPASNKASIRNNDPDPIAQVYLAKMRKGFPFGLELTGVLGFMSHTSFTIVGADVRMSLLEGFRTGAMGVIPDLAVGGAVRTITGSPQVQLTIAGLDAQISKPITIADSSVFAPYVGWQMIWIFGDSGLIDATPNTNAVQKCGYAGPNSPGTPGAPTPDPQDPTRSNYRGDPVCLNGSGSNLDFNNTFVFDRVRLRRQRIVVGGHYRYEMAYIGFQYLTDLLDPSAANDDDPDLRGVPRQYTLSFSVGAFF